MHSKRKSCPSPLLPSLLVLSFALFLAQPGFATHPGKNGKIAFISMRDGNQEIYTMDADGSNQTNLTNTSEYESAPTWSPDGTKIAFERRISTGNVEIFVMNGDGSGALRLTNDSSLDKYPTWSPDGTKIAFQRGSTTTSQELYLINADGTGLTRLTNNAVADGAPDWSPSGDLLVFHRYLTVGNAEIFTINVNDKSQSQLTSTGSENLNPTWSPDGTMLAYEDYSGGYPQIFAMQANGSGAVNLSGDATTFHFWPAWSPDGSKILYHKYIGLNAEIYVMDSDGANQAYLTNNSDLDTMPDWQPLAIGTIVITKNAAPADDTLFMYQDSIAAPNWFLLQDPTTPSKTFTDVPAGSYVVTEAEQLLWELHDLICDDADSITDTTTGSAIIILEAGETVTCTYDSVKKDTVEIRVETVGGDDTFSFVTDLPGGNFDITTSGDSGSNAVSGVSPATYSLSTGAPAGWLLPVADPVCSNGDNASSLTLAAGEKVVCTFQFFAEDTITIVKNVVGGNDTFDFTGDLGAFSLTTKKQTAKQAFTGLGAGTYSVSETVPAGYVLSSATCDNGDSPDSVSIATGEHVTCTFTNTELARLKVVKLTSTEDDTFAFASTIPGFSSFNLTTSGTTASQEFDDLAPGTYSVTESLPMGWKQDSVHCNDDSSPEAIGLSAGEEVICVFANVQPDFPWILFNAPMTHGQATE